MTDKTTPAAGVETLEPLRTELAERDRRITDLQRQVSQLAIERDSARREGAQQLHARLQWEEHSRRETARADTAERQLAAARTSANWGWGIAAAGVAGLLVRVR